MLPNSTLIFLLLSLILSTELTAQVIIKEKVEINPLKKFNINNPTNFPDTAAVKSSNGISLNKLQNKLDNTQSTIFLPEGGKVTVQIILSDAAASSKIDLIQRQPEQQTIIEYANHEVGYSWISTGYPPGSNLEFGIYWYWNYYGTIYEGNEAGSKITQIGENEYEIGFEAAGDDWDYNELVINVTIETYELLVNIEPPTISTGQTAQITVKKQFYDGSIQEFPEGQLFEVGMMEGCAAGALVSAEDTAAYFNGVTQPILFVAADSLENDQETVKIGVGLVEGISGGEIINTKIAESDFNKQKMKKEFLDNNPESINALLIVGSCFGQNFNSKILGYGDVVVGNVCATLPKCTENNSGKKPNFEIMDFPDGTDGIYKCNNVSGITYMLWSENEKKLFLPIEIENCYDENANVIQFGIKDDLITLRAIVTACEDVIVNQGYTILYNTTELKTKVPQNLRALSQLYSDLDIFLDYFTNENPSSPFYPIELTWEHEFQHKKNYINEIFNVVNKDFDYLDYSRLDVSCGKYGNMNDVVDEMKYNFGNKFLDFETQCITKQFEVWGKKDGTPKEIENYKKNEIKTHNAIAKKVIDKYKTEIKKLILSLPK